MSGSSARPGEPAAALISSYAMSQDNVELVRRGYEHFLATGEFLRPDPEFVWDMSHFRGWPEQQLYEGTEGAERFLRDWLGAWDDWQIEIEAFHDAGEKVVTVMRQRARAKATGLPVDMLFAQVWSIHNGKETRMEMYADPTEALKAAGLAD